MAFKAARDEIVLTFLFFRAVSCNQPKRRKKGYPNDSCSSLTDAKQAALAVARLNELHNAEEPNMEGQNDENVN